MLAGRLQSKKRSRLPSLPSPRQGFENYLGSMFRSAVQSMSVITTRVSTGVSRASYGVNWRHFVSEQFLSSVIDAWQGTHGLGRRATVQYSEGNVPKGGRSKRLCFTTCADR